MIRVRINNNGKEFDVQGESENKFFYNTNENSKSCKWEWKANCTVISDNTQPEPVCSRTDKLFIHIFEAHGLRLDDFELEEIIDIVHKSVGAPKDYVGSIEEENAEHEQLLDQAEVAFSIAGFKFERKNLDMIVSMQQLVSDFGGKLDLDTITRSKHEVEERHLPSKLDEQL